MASRTSSRTSARASRTALPWDRAPTARHLVRVRRRGVWRGGAAATIDASRRPRLGVRIETVNDGVRVQQVEKGSIAEAAGIREGDIVNAAAGVAVKEPGDLRAAVQRQAPGTWLPLRMKRGPDTLDLVANFPPQPE